MRGKELEEKCRSACHTCGKETLEILHLISPKLHNFIYQYKGYMFKENGGFNNREWHSAVFSVGLIGLAYLLTPPINLIPLLLWFLVLRRIVTDDINKDSGKVLKEINDNPHYYLLHGTLTILVMELNGVSLGLEDTSLEMLGVVTKLFGV